MTEPLQLIIPGAVCECGRIGNVTHTVRKLSNGKPHPKPYRRFECDCGRKWREPIPENMLLRVATKD